MPQQRPQVWDEAGRPVDFKSLEDGFLVKVAIDVVMLADSDLFGFYRGVGNSGVGPTPEYFILEVPDNIAPNTVPGFCNGRRHQYSLHHVKLVEIVAREQHTARLIFDSVGRLKLKYHHLSKVFGEISKKVAGF
ncbi:MAG: hypothetical protein AAB758_02510 [Patescibacteria group bacterium]